MPYASLPERFDGVAFSRSEGLAGGLSRRVIDGPRCVRVLPGWYRYAHTKPTLAVLARAGNGWLGPESGLSHLSALAWRGLDLRRDATVHLATRRRVDRTFPGFRVHRFLGDLELEQVRGIHVLGVRRTFVDCATILPIGHLVAVGDWLITQGLVTKDDLLTYVAEVHHDGVLRARRAIELVREKSESPQESVLRVVLVRHGLPEPEINVDLVTGDGRFLARGDLVYRGAKVLVEHGGWHHERDGRQRQHDVLRRERLEAHGWRVIVVTATDLRRPSLVARRVRSALHARRGQDVLPQTP